MASSPEDLLKKYKNQCKAMTDVASEYEPLWRDIRDYFAPRTARFFGERTNDGARKDNKIINTSPRYAVRALASGMQSGLTSPIRPWFRLGLADPDATSYQPFQVWLSDVERILRDLMAKSNLYDRLKSIYGSLGLYGTSCLFIDEDDQDVFRAQDLMTGTFMLTNDQSGRATVLYRRRAMTSMQMVERFGLERVPDRVRSAYDRGDYLQDFEVLHIVERNRDYRPSSELSKFKEWSSIWIDPTSSDADAFLSIKGYDSMPMMGVRWDVVGDDAYGVGCGELALGDGKQLQKMEALKLKAIEKNIDPHMVADSSMRNQKHGKNPGEVTYVNGLISGNQGYRPAYQSNPYINEMRAEIELVAQRIDEAFYKNLFLVVTDMADQPNITATQINAIREEKLLQLGPVTERLNDELLDPIIERTYSLALNRGLLPPPPDELQGMPLNVTYISVMAQAQKAMGLGNIERFVGFVGQVAQFDQQVMDRVDFDQIIEEYADGIAVPPRIVRGEDEADAMRQARQQQQQVAAGMEMMQQGAAAAKSLSDTSVTGDNALTRSLEAAGVGL